MADKNTTNSNMYSIVNTDANQLPTTIKPSNLPIATVPVIGAVRPDGSSITITPDGTISATAPSTTGRGWIISIDWNSNNVPVSPAWTGNDAIPRFLANGQVVQTQGINSATYWGAVRSWVSGNPVSADTQYIANLYEAWNNSFSDALTIVSVLVEDESGRFRVTTAVPTTNPTQSDTVVKALFNVNNSGFQDTNHMSGISYDDAGGAYPYQRAMAISVVVSTTLQNVLNTGNTATNANSGVSEIRLTNNATNTTSVLNGSSLSSTALALSKGGNNLTLQTPATISNYALTLPAAAPVADGQVMVFTQGGVASFQPSVAAPIALVTFSAWGSTAFSNINQINLGESSFTISGNATIGITPLASGTTISFNSLGAPRYIIDQVSYNAGNNITTVSLFSAITVPVLAATTIYIGVPDTSSQRVNAINLGPGISSVYANNVLALNATGGGGPGTVGSLDQVTAVGSNSSRSISLQNGTFNGLSLNIPNNQSAAPVIQAIGAVSVSNVPLALQTKGSGSLLLGTDLATNSSSTIGFSSTGLMLDITPGSGGGTPIFNYLKQVNVYDSLSGTGVEITGGANRGVRAGPSTGNNILTLASSGNANLILGNAVNSLINILAVANISVLPNNSNSSLTLRGSGIGNVYLGNSTSTLQFGFALGAINIIPDFGNPFVAVTLSAKGGSSISLDNNVTLTPNVGGEVYLIGSTLSSTAANQPQIIVASAQGVTTLGPGTPGQVITSNGTNGAPYWGTASFQSINQTIFTINSTAVGSTSSTQYSNITTGSPTSSTFTTRLNNLGLVLNGSTGTIIGWATGATYEVRMTVNLFATNTQALATYWCATGNSGAISEAAYGNGVAVALVRQLNNYGGNGLPVEVTGVWTPASSSTPLYLTYYTEQVSTGGSLRLNITLSILRIS